MKNILIVGAGGGIGKKLVDYFYKHTAYNLILNYSSEKDIPDIINSNRVSIVVGKIGTDDIFKELFDNVGILIHLGSSVNPEEYSGKWQNAYKYGADSTLSLFDYIRDNLDSLHIIFPSSGGSVYTQPQEVPYIETDITMGWNPYGIQKLMFENYLKLLVRSKCNISCNILRISNPYGLSVKPNRKQGFIDILIEKSLMNETVNIWSGLDVIRDYIYIDDLTDAFVKALEYKNGYEIFNIGSNVGVSLGEVIALLSRNLKINVNYNLVESGSNYYPGYNVLNISKAKKFLGWSPKITIEQGIKLLGIRDYD
ncbi:NAD-dependent epimerase/dehydratase family protein [Oxalobacter formigenes]|uniref:NAD-dependent epimerase/dehydratase family protein n=1 Tax=Oxalobacter formigenes TaxID=847 RepID=UPI00241E47D5|nr:NAD-dependent epimerase/dehydratase family protein [Oxalobacter formigenes]